MVMPDDGRDARYLSLLKAEGGTWPAAKADAEAELKHLPPIHGSIHPSIINFTLVLPLLIFPLPLSPSFSSTLSFFNPYTPY